MPSKMLDKVLVQEKLRSKEETLDSLKVKLGIHFTRHSTYPNLVLLKYDMIDSPMGDQLVQQCRGIILDENDNWKIIARPFDKFFNEGEGHAAVIDYSTARFLEKVDGSLIFLYWYDKHWEIATSGTPDAGGEVNGFNFTFKDYFQQTFKAQEMALPNEDHSENTFMFELAGPENRIVVRHPKRNITFLGARDRNTGQEYFAKQFEVIPAFHNWSPVKEFPLTNLDSIMESFKAMDPLNQEGYVVVDQLFNRVKVKHPGYVAIHHMRGEGALSPKRVLSIIRAGETTEVLANFPEWKPAFDTVSVRYFDLIKHLETEYEKIKNIVVQKDFALEAVKTRCSGALFRLRKGQVTSIPTHLSEMSIDALADILDLKNVTLETMIPEPGGILAGV